MANCVVRQLPKGALASLRILAKGLPGASADESAFGRNRTFSFTRLGGSRAVGKEMSERTKFNFCPVSDKDNLVFGSHRPGPKPNDDKTVGDPPVTTSQVDDWVRFMKENNVKHVVSLIEQDEKKKVFDGDVDAVMHANFEYVNVGIKEPGALNRIMSVLESSVQSGEKVVVHCVQGYSRTGFILAAYLVKHHGLTPEEAAAAVEKTAAENNAKRAVDVELLKKALAHS